MFQQVQTVKGGNEYLSTCPSSYLTDSLDLRAGHLLSFVQVASVCLTISHPRTYTTLPNFSMSTLKHVYKQSGGPSSRAVGCFPTKLPIIPSHDLLCWLSLYDTHRQKWKIPDISHPPKGLKETTLVSSKAELLEWVCQLNSDYVRFALIN